MPTYLSIPLTLIEIRSAIDARKSPADTDIVFLLIDTYVLPSWNQF